MAEENSETRQKIKRGITSVVNKFELCHCEYACYLGKCFFDKWLTKTYMEDQKRSTTQSQNRPTWPNVEAVLLSKKVNISSRVMQAVPRHFSPNSPIDLQ